MFCLLFRTINNSEDASLLQQDLDRLHQWTVKWQMQFNTDKCHSMKFSLRRNSLLQPNTILEVVSPHLLKTIHTLAWPFLLNMSWTKHINGATSRANRILGLIRRNLRGAVPQDQRKGLSLLGTSPCWVLFHHLESSLQKGHRQNWTYPTSSRKVCSVPIPMSREFYNYATGAPMAFSRRQTQNIQPPSYV